MKIATVALHKDGEEVWAGSLIRFARDNDMRLTEVREITNWWRRERIEPFGIGGGAAATFDLHLVEALE